MVGNPYSNPCPEPLGAKPLEPIPPSSQEFFLLNYNANKVEIQSTHPGPNGNLTTAPNPAGTLQD